MDESQELIQEFLIESNENLTRLDQEFVELEQRPDDKALLSSVFRTIHTIKGTCGFLGFTTLEAITHRAENILSQLRDGDRQLNPALTTLLLETVDVVKKVLAEIEASGQEGSEPYQGLRDRLQAACEGRESGAGGLAASPAGTPPGAPTPAGDAAEGGSRQGEAGASGEPDKELLEPPVPSMADSLEPGTASADGSSIDTPNDPVPGGPEAGIATAQSAAGPAAGGAPKSSVAESNIRVDVGLLDKLMNLVGELVLARNQILQHTSTLADASFTATSQRLNLITTELQANVMKTRMQPIGMVWNKLPRIVRDIGQSLGKQIDLEMEGAKTELDKTIIEAIKDPLTHLIRNSCDHGIELPDERAAKGKPPRGTLSLRAYHEGGQVNIEISDDGAGIDLQRLKQKAMQAGLLSADQAERKSDRELMNLIFLPGLSTAKKVTNVSGRGVGMDVVKTNIERIGGSIDLQSWAGRGTTIKIKIPLTLAIIPALVVTCVNERFAIPQVNLVELVRLETGSSAQQIEWIHGAPVYRLRGKLLPLVYLNQILGLQEAPAGAAGQSHIVNIIVLQADERTFGLVVDGVNDTAEIVVKPLAKLLKGLNCYAGATIMGDGNVALILDVMGLAQLGGVVSEARDQVHLAEEAQTDQTAERQTVLLFRSGSTKRLAVPLSLVDRLEEFAPSQIETSGGREVIQYRGQILPLLPLAGLLALSEPTEKEPDDSVQVVVFSEGDKRIGIVVDEIVDIAEETITIRSRTARAGILGSAVVSGHVTDFIDLHYIIEAVGKEWFGGSAEAGVAGAQVLVAEGSAFSRGLMRNCLEMAGYRVFEAADGEALIEQLSREQIDIVVSSLDLPGSDPFELLKRIRQAPEWSQLPILGLTASADETEFRRPSEYQFDDYQLKFDRDSMLRSIERLAASTRAGQLVEQRS